METSTREQSGSWGERRAREPLSPRQTVPSIIPRAQGQTESVF